MVYIYFFSSTYAASPYAYAAEILPTKNRANGVAIGLFFANCVTLTFSQCAPIALEKIGWKFNLVFIACNLFFLPIVWFFFPEVRGNGAFTVVMKSPADRYLTDERTFSRGDQRRIRRKG